MAKKPTKPTKKKTEEKKTKKKAAPAKKPAAKKAPAKKKAAEKKAPAAKKPVAKATKAKAPKKATKAAAAAIVNDMPTAEQVANFFKANVAPDLLDSLMTTINCYLVVTSQVLTADASDDPEGDAAEAEAEEGEGEGEAEAEGEGEGEPEAEAEEGEGEAEAEAEGEPEEGEPEAEAEESEEGEPEEAGEEEPAEASEELTFATLHGDSEEVLTEAKEAIGDDVKVAKDVLKTYGIRIAKGMKDAEIIDKAADITAAAAVLGGMDNDALAEMAATHGVEVDIGRTKKEDAVAALFVGALVQAAHANSVVAA